MARFSIAVRCGLVFACTLIPLTAGPYAADQSLDSIRAGAKAGQEWSGNGLKMKFCWCPAGKFTMGSPKYESFRFVNEEQVQVTLTQGFWLAKHEVTQEQWQRMMGTTVSGQRDKANQSLSLYGEGDALPMYFVSYNEALEFCERLTKQERAAERLPAGWRFRLPTEAQWEYGCRAGTLSATAFGDKLSSSQANFDGNAPYNEGEKGPSLHTCVRVGSYPANAWGLHDMHGNVWEWCDDWYASQLPGGSDPRVTVKASSRVTRGGSWFINGRFCRSAYRFYVTPESRNFLLGFRVAAVQWSEPRAR